MKSQIEHDSMDGYEVCSYYSSNDEAFVAVIDELPGCAADGTTREEAVQNLLIAKEDWIAAMVRFGHAIPAPQLIPGSVLA